MNLAFGIAAAVAGAACGWPASKAIAAFSAARRGLRGVRRRPCPAPACRKLAGARRKRPGARRSGLSPGARGNRWILPVLAAAAMGVLAGAAALRLHPAGAAIAGCWLASCGLPLAVIDVRASRLPDALTATALAGVGAGLLAAAAESGSWAGLARAAAGAGAVGAFFGLLALIRPGSAGLGDAKLGLSTGALAAWFGWDVLLWSVFAAFLLAAATALALLAARRISFRSGSLPFGPFLLAGCLAVVLLAGPAR